MQRLTIPIVLLLIALTVAACGGPAAPASGGAPAGATPGPTKVSMALGYIPDVQFAPFYMAKERGFYGAEGLDVEFNHTTSTDLLKLIGTGEIGFGVASGDEVLVARSQGVPLVYVGAWFQKFPISVIALERAGIRRVEDLKGRTIGVPGRFGATYVGLRALLVSAGLSESDVQIREIGFKQVQALTEGQVEAVVGYTNNEPVQLRALGQSITTIEIFDHVTLAANGIVTNEKTLRERPELVEKVVRASLRGIEDVIARPDEALDTVLPKYTPEAAPRREVLRQVIGVSLPLWQSEQTAQRGIGYSDPAVWTASRDLLRRLNLLGGEVDLDKIYTNRFVAK